MIEQVQPGDVADVEALFKNARYTFQRIWLSSLKGSSSEGCLFAVRDRSRVLAALACSRQNPVVFALSGAAFAREEDISLAFLPLLEHLAAHAGERGASVLTYVGAEEWLLPHLTSANFAHSDDVITLMKTGRDTISPTHDETLRVRPVRESDIPALTALDAAAFRPEWHYGRAVLDDALRSVSTFLVAESEGLAGYAYGGVRLSSAHLTRLAVAPDRHGRGIGASLLSASLRAFYRQAAWMVTLNTQKSNVPSQRLYQRFGFEPVGRPIPLMVYALARKG